MDDPFVSQRSPSERSEWFNSLFPEPRPRPKAMPASAKAAVQKAAAEQPAAMITEPMSNQKRRRFPHIRLSIWNSEDAFRRQRQQDPEQQPMGIGIRILMRCTRNDCTDEYYGEYVQHSAYNTTFRLLSLHRSNTPAKFDNKFLKITQRSAIEVDVFQKVHNLNFTTKILYAADAMDEDSGDIFYSWITEECIPLNQCLAPPTIFNCHNQRELHIDKTICCQAVYYCILQAANANLYMTDCTFENFGLMITHDAAHHAVVIIDVGSNAFESSGWSRVDIDIKIMHKFWAYCEAAGHDVSQLKTQWQSHATLEAALAEAQEQWRWTKTLTPEAIMSYTIALSLSRREQRFRHRARQSEVFQFVMSIGRAIEGEQWTNDCAIQCCRASEERNAKLSAPQVSQLMQLLSRISCCGEQDQIIRFWIALDTYRNGHCARIGHDVTHPLTKQQAQKLLIQYRNTVLWYQLSAEQQRASNWRSILNALVHKQAGWKLAAVFILQHGLPSVHCTGPVHDVQQHIQRLAVFASAIARWFHTFAHSMAAMHDSPEYIRQRSLSDLRDNCDSDPHR